MLITLSLSLILMLHDYDCVFSGNMEASRSGKQRRGEERGTGKKGCTSKSRVILPGSPSHRPSPLAGTPGPQSACLSCGDVIADIHVCKQHD